MTSSSPAPPDERPEPGDRDRSTTAADTGPAVSYGRQPGGILRAAARRYRAEVARRIAFFDPMHGIGLRVEGGSGRSWMEHPSGDPGHAHCRIDVPRDTLLPSLEPEPRPASNTLFVAWDDLLRFADQLAGLAAGNGAGNGAASGAGSGTGTVSLGDRATRLTIRMRHDGRLRAETAFTLGHHVTVTLRCQTLWTRHFGVREDLPDLADQVRAAVHHTRPRRRT